jgi:small GTP-binding protein
MKQPRLILALCLAIVALGLLIWLVSSVQGFYDRIAQHSQPMAVALIGLIVAASSACALMAARLFWKLGHSGEATKPVQAPTDMIQAAEVQAEKAREAIAKVEDPQARARLDQELNELQRDRANRRFHVVVFGTGSAGKTSLINALLGETVGRTDAVMGTTKHGAEHTYEVDGVDGTLLVTDTPGMSEIGEAGRMREAEARDLAARADLVLFVVDHDLVRTEYEPLVALARQGKRSIVVLNKKDRMVDADREAILAKLRERLDGVVPPADVVAVAADPRPMHVRVRKADGTTETLLEAEEPDLSSLEKRIELVLNREGDSLRAGNLLLRAHMIGKAARDELARQREKRVQALIDRYQWVTAAAVFTNPLPALDLLATGAVQLQMISELAQVYGVDLAMPHVRTIGGQMAQLLLKLGIVEAASSLIAGLFKSTLVGYTAGGAVQAVTMAYLTHISGHAFAEYLARGQSWGDGGMQAAIERQFQLNSRAEFLQEFAKQALDNVVKKVKGTASAATQGRTM